jgi:hypothetical protein
MEIPGKNYKEINSNVDITALRKAVLSATPEEWLENTFRQENFYGAAEVKTILFNLNMGNEKKDLSRTFVFYKVWDKWKHLVQPVLDEVIKYYDRYEEAFINKAMLTNMAPGTTIPRHWDKGACFAKSHRIHVPILTNDEVYFIVDEERCLMEVGKAYELNNVKLHSVENNGNSDRVHLLFDVYISSKFDQEL